MEWFYKETKKSPWRKYFAWKRTPIGTYPLKDGQKIVWLKWVERKWLDCREGCNRYEYREIEKCTCVNPLRKKGYTEPDAAYETCMECFKEVK